MGINWQNVIRIISGYWREIAIICLIMVVWMKNDELDKCQTKIMVSQTQAEIMQQHIASTSKIVAKEIQEIRPLQEIVIRDIRHEIKSNPVYSPCIVPDGLRSKINEIRDKSR